MTSPAVTPAASSGPETSADSIRHASARRPAPLSRRAMLARRALMLLAWALVASLFGQVFTAGMAVFADPGWWAWHRTVLHAFEWIVPLTLVLALAGRTPRAIVGLAAATVLLLVVQYTTAHLRLSLGMQKWAAVHPVSAMLLVWTAIELARRSTRLVRAGSSDAGAAADAGSTAKASAGQSLRAASGGVS